MGMVPDENGTMVELMSSADLVSPRDVEYKVVKAWSLPGGKVGFLRLQSITAGDFIEWTEANEGEAKKTAGLRLIIKSAVDENGKLLWDDKGLAHLRMKNHKDTEDVVREILKLNRMRTKDQKDDEAKKD